MNHVEDTVKSSLLGNLIRSMFPPSDGKKNLSNILERSSQEVEDESDPGPVDIRGGGKDGWKRSHV